MKDQETFQRRVALSAKTAHDSEKPCRIRGLSAFWKKIFK